MPPGQEITLLQSLHYGGVPPQLPPKLSEKQDPMRIPERNGPVYLTVQPLLLEHL